MGPSVRPLVPSPYQLNLFTHSRGNRQPPALRASYPRACFSTGLPFPVTLAFTCLGTTLF